MSRHPNSKPFRILGSRQASVLASATTPKEKELLRERIEADVEAFLARGGVIKDADIKPVLPKKSARKNQLGRNW